MYGNTVSRENLLMVGQPDNGRQPENYMPLPSIVGKRIKTKPNETSQVTGHIGDDLHSQIT